MNPEQDPRNMGESIAQGIPGVGILMMLRQLGEKMPGQLQQAMQLLGLGPQPAQGQQYGIHEPLPRFGGQDAQGNPIIIPPGR